MASRVTSLPRTRLQSAPGPERGERGVVVDGGAVDGEEGRDNVRRSSTSAASSRALSNHPGSSVAGSPPPAPPLPVITRASWCATRRGLRVMRRNNAKLRAGGGDAARAAAEGAARPPPNRRGSSSTCSAARAPAARRLEEDIVVRRQRKARWTREEGHREQTEVALTDQARARTPTQESYTKEQDPRRKAAALRLPPPYPVGPPGAYAGVKFAPAFSPEAGREKTRLFPPS